MRIRLVVLILLIFIWQSASSQLTLQDIFNSGKYREKYPENLEFMKNDKFYTVQEGNAVLKKETITGKIADTLLAHSDTINKGKFSLFEYDFSEDESLLLLAGNKQGIYRRSYNADYVIFDFKKRSFIDLNPISEDNRISYPTFSADGKKVAYVLNNNLFVFDLQSNTHKQITFDGKKNAIINGSTDWVYEEEFEFVKAFKWSPDSKFIAFLKFDESQVPEYTLQKWTGLYPENYVFKYPKAGEKNAKVDIYVFNLSSEQSIKLPLDSTDSYYVPRFEWIREKPELLILSLNRLQRKLTFDQFDPVSQKSLRLYSNEFPQSIELESNLYFSKVLNKIILSGKVVNKDGIYAIKNLGRSSLEQYTDLLDSEVEFVDDNNGFIYFTTTAVKPENKYCYRLNIKNKVVEKVSVSEGSNSITVSRSANYFIISNNSSGVPSTFTLFDAKTKKPIRELENNKALRTQVESLKLPRQEFFTFETSEKVTLQSWMIKPAVFDSTKKYPVIMFVYGGPGSQMVRNNWGGSYYLWFQYLASQGFIVTCVDGRGTGGKGTEFRNVNYEKLGELETKDQIQTAKYLGSLPFVDKARIGIWGWSFGGYLSTLSLLKGNDVFKAAIAVAPVTSWRFYDTIYTERYLNTPQDNTKGYDENSPLNYAGNLKGKYLLVHGTSDDNVHMQNTLAMQEALIKSGKQFETFIYPNKSHGISGGNSRLHLFTMMLDFWNRNLK